MARSPGCSTQRSGLCMPTHTPLPCVACRRPAGGAGVRALSICALPAEAHARDTAPHGLPAVCAQVTPTPCDRVRSAALARVRMFMRARRAADVPCMFADCACMWGHSRGGAAPRMHAGRAWGSAAAVGCMHASQAFSKNPWQQVVCRQRALPGVPHLPDRTHTIRGLGAARAARRDV